MKWMIDCLNNLIIMALNFTLFDPTYQTSNFYSAIAQIEKGGFKVGIYEVFEWAKD